MENSERNLDTVALMQISFEFLAEALKRAYGMPDDTIIEDIIIEHDIRHMPTNRTLLIRVNHPAFPKRLEGEQLMTIRPTVSMPIWNWNA